MVLGVLAWDLSDRIVGAGLIFFAPCPVENLTGLPYNLVIAVENHSHFTPVHTSRANIVHALLPITALRPGQVAEVRQVVGSPEHVRRLEELGLRDGARLEMVRAGSPCIVRIGASTLCLRNGELLAVMVAPRMSA